MDTKTTFKFDTNYLWGELQDATYTETGTYPMNGRPSRPGFGTVTGVATKGRRTRSVMGGRANTESIIGDTISLHYVPRESFDRARTGTEYRHHTCG